MNEEEKKEKEERAAQALISNTEEIAESAPEQENVVASAPAKEAEAENKIFRKYKIKDIVFLAIMAACMLVTGAIMPLVGNIPVFGIIQVCLGLQFSVFPVIGMMKVRKPCYVCVYPHLCGDR